MSEIPTELKYTKTHEWLRKEDALITVGITDNAQKLLGDIVFVELPELQSEFQEGKECGVIESVKAASDFIVPMNVQVVEVNKALESEPALINQDPYGKGWIVKVKPQDIAAFDSLLDAKNYTTILECD